MPNEIESEFLKGYSDRDLLVTSLERIKGLRSDLDARDARFVESFTRIEREVKEIDKKFTTELDKQEKNIVALKTDHDQRQGANKAWRIAGSVIAVILMALQIAAYFK